VKYRNAAELLPPQLLQELQRYTAGEALYIPSARRKPWGEGTGAKAFYARRNADIRSRFSQGVLMDELSENYCISEDAVHKIIYRKGDATMNPNEFNTAKYYMQNELVRVRRSRPDDWKYHNAGYDSEERFFTDGEQELPTDENLWREKWENYIGSNSGNDKHICLAFETPEGEYVGGGNIHAIDERNGTFGIFLGAKEDRYYLAAARLMLDFAFNERRLNKCHTLFLDGDERNLALFEKLGFRREGVIRGQVFHQGHYWDEHHVGLFAAEFNAQEQK